MMIPIQSLGHEQGARRKRTYCARNVRVLLMYAGFDAPLHAPVHHHFVSFVIYVISQIPFNHILSSSKSRKENNEWKHATIMNGGLYKEISLEALRIEGIREINSCQSIQKDEHTYE